MPRAAVKIAVTVPADLFRALEKERKRAGKNRSAAVQDALRQWIRSRAYAEMVREYETGYAAAPEASGEIEAAMHLALEGLAEEEDW